jgi:hypothetical protein
MERLMVDIWVRLLRFVPVLAETMITPLNVRQTDGDVVVKVALSRVKMEDV